MIVSLEPSVGVTSRSPADLWAANPELATSSRNAEGRLNMELAYGAGLRYGLGSGLELDLKALHRQGTDNAENSILLELQTEL